jgi:DNA-binding MarR family transcriptional regulator
MERPIGFWLKRLDTLIESRFETALAAYELTRRHWQVLNTVSSGSVTRAEVDAAVAPFLASSPGDAQRCVDDLVARGWVAEGAALSLTPAGVAGHVEVAAVAQQQREAVLTGISPEEYARTVATLERMATNLA